MTNLLLRLQKKKKEGIDNKIDLMFVTTIGTKRKIIASKKYPIGAVLIFYLFRIGKLEIITELMNGEGNISFLYNATVLSIRGKETIGNIFKGVLSPKIVVNDANALIGG